ncbi:uncharacterized protein LOC113239557 [Hyposmocoma kahamanoa]|uniref:uncharacterized protein LOC113239557 n=1 Tax=Hyposmocoma kahamanoa TaxID=1477025 RepID=UPI000E6D90A1|nr:uncharacterized protein LOC113239557 [Hyposmocoma kahamanoa]
MLEALKFHCEPEYLRKMVESYLSDRAEIFGGTTLVAGGASIAVKSTMKYLGLVLDSQWRFEEHFRLLAPNLVGTASALSMLLPNVGEPSANYRRLYTEVVRSMAMYGAPIWANSHTAQGKTLMRRPQYPTMGSGRRGAVSFLQSAELRAEGEEPLLEHINRCRAEIWPLDHRSDSTSPGRMGGSILGRHLLPPCAGSDEHDCFGKYLCNVRREPTTVCHQCGCAEDTAQHTL